jgi:hypothetical protein
MARKNPLSSFATLTTEFQTTSGSNVSTITVCWEHHEMSFHGGAARHKPKITMHNAKSRLEGCNVHRPLDYGAVKSVLWRDESHSTI